MILDQAPFTSEPPTAHLILYQQLPLRSWLDQAPFGVFSAAVADTEMKKNQNRNKNIIARTIS